MMPGDLVKLGRGSAARLYRTPDMWEKPEHICAVVHGDEVGLVIGMADGENFKRAVLFLFGQKLGWRDPLPFVVVK